MFRNDAALTPFVLEPVTFPSSLTHSCTHSTCQEAAEQTWTFQRQETVCVAPPQRASVCEWHHISTARTLRYNKRGGRWHLHSRTLQRQKLNRLANSSTERLNVLNMNILMATFDIWHHWTFEEIFDFSRGESEHLWDRREMKCCEPLLFSPLKVQFG